jgi:DNA-binding NtrC family response regulator/predicted TIM-barrel enzyme
MTPMNNAPNLLRSILQEARSSSFPLIFVIPGSGQIARCAVEGGAQFLMVLNAGLYRMAGVSPVGSFMPFGNANEQTEELLQKQILPRTKDFPIVAGVMANDSVQPTAVRLERLRGLGIAGITNWPAVGLIDGRLREALTQDGFTVEKEIEMLSEARKGGFVTFGFVTTVSDAMQMSEAGVEALVFNAGWTHETQDIYEKNDRIEYLIVKVNEIFNAVRCSGANPLFLFFGGAVTTPEDSAELYRRTEIHGFGGGSAFERIPVNNLVTHIVRQFCSVPRHPRTLSFGAGIGEIVGATPVMLKLYKLIERVAPFNVNVCVEGESGVGKELIALQLHRLSRRASMPFITLNCGAIPDTLLESEFFGHEKGSFTGAFTRRIGKLELAHQGTLLLDEVAELSPKAQVSLLRVIQQQEITRVGGDKKIPIDVRIITATHQDLKALVDRGQFRADLYYRLNTITLKVPPLRDRKQDIPALVDKFLNELGPQFGHSVLGITPEFMTKLMRHFWPGNVRELRHALSRALLLEEGPVLQGNEFIPDSAPPFLSSPSVFNLTTQSEVKETGSDGTAEAIKVSGGNKSKAAKLLGISRKTLYARLNKSRIN